MNDELLMIIDFINIERLREPQPDNVFHSDKLINHQPKTIN